LFASFHALIRDWKALVVGEELPLKKLATVSSKELPLDVGLPDPETKSWEFSSERTLSVGPVPSVLPPTVEP